MFEFLNSQPGAVALAISILGYLFHAVWSASSSTRKQTIERWVTVAVQRAAATGIDWKAALEGLAPELGLSDAKMKFAELVAHEAELYLLRNSLQQLGDAAAKAKVDIERNNAFFGIATSPNAPAPAVIP